MTTLIKGIDISSLQGTVDFRAVAATGVQFVIVRCAVGNDGTDSMYAKNIAAAKAAGLKVGAYNFVYPLPTIPGHESRAPAAQAAAHVKAANGEIPFCDLEWPVQSDWSRWGCTAASIVEWVTEYLQAYEQLSGQRPIVYTYPYFANSINLPASFGQTYKLWIASYESTPTIPKPWTDWVMWQNSGGTQKLPNGVPVDTDYVKDLSLWLPVVVPPAPPAPVVVNPPTPVPIPVPVPPPAPAPVVPSTSIWQQWAIFIGKFFGKK
jgi:lysozyme